MASAHDGNNGQQSLAEKVEQLLSRDGKFHFGRNYTGFSQNDADQVVSLNKYFRGELAKAPVSTIDERGCLRDDLAPAAWLKYFQSHVLPTLNRFNLPSE
jgi:hypothetical protein